MNVKVNQQGLIPNYMALCTTVPREPDQTMIPKEQFKGEEWELKRRRSSRVERRLRPKSYLLGECEWIARAVIGV